MNSLANDLLNRSIKPLKPVYVRSGTGRPPKYFNESGEPESATSIGERYGCSYGKVMWLFKKYITYQEVYKHIGLDARANNGKNQYTTLA